MVATSLQEWIHQVPRDNQSSQRVLCQRFNYCVSLSVHMHLHAMSCFSVPIATLLVLSQLLYVSNKKGNRATVQCTELHVRCDELQYGNLAWIRCMTLANLGWSRVRTTTAVAPNLPAQHRGGLQRPPIQQLLHAISIVGKFCQSPQFPIFGQILTSHPLLFHAHAYLECSM